MPAGNYDIEISPNWKTGDVRDYTVTIYAPKKIALLSNSTKKANEPGKIESRYISASKTYNNGVIPPGPIYDPKGTYNLTGVLVKDISAAKNASGLKYTAADWWHYDLRRKEKINSTHEELLWYFGNNNTFIEVNVTLNVWALKQTYKLVGGDQAKNCVVTKPANGYDFISCTCRLNAYLKPAECILGVVG